MKIHCVTGFSVIALTLSLGTVASAQTVPSCVASQLTLSVDSKGGQFDGMQKSGTELSIRNVGRDCMLPALPRIDFLDAHGRVVPVSRRAPVGMHPGPVMIPVRLAAGHRAATDITWISGPAYARNRTVQVRYLRVSVGFGSLRTRFAGVIDIEPGTPGTFSQPPMRPMEGMAAG